jgi:replicative DNA helicase
VSATVPPHSEDAEMALLGAQLIGADGRQTFLALLAEHGLRAEHFYRPRHRLIFDAMVALSDRNEPLDALTVSDELDENGKLEDAGGTGYVHSLATTVPSVGNTAKYVAIVREQAWLRDVLAAARLLQEAVEHRDRDAIATASAALLEPEAAERAITIERRQHDLVEHVERGKLDLAPWPFRRLTEMTGGLWPGHLTIIIGHSTHGKALALDTPVPTPDGWRTMGSLERGDVVFGADGSPVRVDHAWPVLLGRDCYEVEFSDGARIVADADHQWQTYSPAARVSEVAAGARVRTAPGRDQRHKRTLPAVVTTEQLAEALSEDDRPHSIPVAAAVAYPHRDLPLDPYVLGAWLGDGDSRNAALTAHRDDAEHLAAQVAMTGEEVSLRPIPGREHIVRVPFGSLTRTCRRGHAKEPGVRCRLCHNLAAKAHARGVPTSAIEPRSRFTGRERLRALGVLQDKHIPAAYLESAPSQRLALLQGLMDTDGTVTPRGKCEIVVTRRRLAEDILDLALGLGMRATLTERAAKLNGREVGRAYRVGFVTDQPVCRLQRKLERLPRRVGSKATHRYIHAVRPVPSVPVRCIAVDAPDRLFLVGRSHIATHNSVLADQVLEVARKHGARCCAYLTEMTPLERDLRFVARRADIPLKRLMHAKLADEGERRRFARAVEELPFEIVPAGTWTVADIGRDIRRRAASVVVIDLLNAISGRDTRDIDESVARLAGVANDTGCHIIGCHHLNRARLTGATYPPEPNQGDIRGSGSVFDLATNVLSVYRHERDDSGEPGEEATLRFLKVKNGIVGKLGVVFNGNRMRFEVPADPATVGAFA